MTDVPMLDGKMPRATTRESLRWLIEHKQCSGFAQCWAAAPIGIREVITDSWGEDPWPVNRERLPHADMPGLTPETCPERDAHGTPFRYCPVKGCGWHEDMVS